MRKKLIIPIMFMLVLSLSVSAYFYSDDVLNQSELDKINFSTVSLNYTFNDVEYDINTLRMAIVFSHRSITPVTWLGERMYYLDVDVRSYEYNELSFWECITNNTMSGTSCLIKHVMPVWIKRFTIDDKLSRRIYASYQTRGKPLFDANLTQYISMTYN